MKRALALFFLAGAAFAYYQHYYEDYLTTINLTYWYQNGTLTAASQGLTSSSANGGSLISKVAVPDGSSEYQVFSNLNLPSSGGTYYQYLRASNDAMSGPAPQGSFYSVEFRNPTFNGPACTATLAVQKRVGGVLTLLSSATVPCYTSGTSSASSVATGSRSGRTASGTWTSPIPPSPRASPASASPAHPRATP